MDTISPFILFVVEKPPKDQTGKEDVRWVNFCASAFDNDILWPGTKSEKPNDPRTRLADNVWLLDLLTDAPFLGRLIAVAKSNIVALPYNYLVFDGLPIWGTWAPEQSNSQVPHDKS
jgi:hypothetical protein